MGIALVALHMQGGIRMPHVMDVTMFWGEHSGGIRQYVLAKQAWISRTPTWQHTLAAPNVAGLDAVPVTGVPLPGTGGYRLPLWTAGLAGRIQAAGPDLIEIGDPFFLSTAAFTAARSLQIPVFGFCHSNVVALAMRWGGARVAALAQKYLRRIYGQCDLVLAPSQDMVDKLRAWGLERVCLQRLGVDTGVFRPDCREPGWRQDLGLPSEVRVLVYAGRFAPEKNLHVLTGAVERLGPACVLVCIGDGPRPPSGSHVIRLPFTNDRGALARMLASADAFVHAGDQETFGLSVLEALACGCPVVCRGAAGLAELIDERVGHIVDSNEPSDFAQAIWTTLCRDREAMSREARKRALLYSWNSLLPELFGRYEALLQPRYSATCAVKNAKPAANNTSLG